MEKKKKSDREFSYAASSSKTKTTVDDKDTIAKPLMDIDSVCGSNPDQFVDDQLLWNDMLADSYENRVDDHAHDCHDHHDYDLLGRPSMWFNGNSSDCWSAASEALSLDPGGPGGAASEAVSLTQEGSTGHLKRNHDCDHHHHHHVEELHSAKEIMDNPIKQLSSCEIHLLPSEASHDDGEDVMSVEESDGDEVQSESTVHFQDPELGMKFPSEEEAYKFYTTYAKKIGFRVRKGKVQRLTNGAIRKRYFFCSREGFKCKKDQSTKAAAAAKYHRKETRTGCEAMIQFTIEKNGDWVISRFSPDHNHELEGKSKPLIAVSPINALEDHLMSTTMKNIARTEAEAEAETEAEAGAAANSAEIHDKYCSSFLDDEKTNCVQLVDGQSLIDYFRHIQLHDPSFLFTVQVNDKNCLTNFFWTDGRSKLDYDCFGDVLVLDTTLIDAYNMVFATFLGINHHGKYVLFGGALLLDSSVASFVWLFRTFMEVMGRRQPKTIFTDLCQAMEAAIEVALPGTQHLLGTWYILQNATKHLPKNHGQSDFDSLFKKCICDCESEEEFEAVWESLLEQCDDLWLKTLYALRRKWSRFCSESIFSAGLRSIQGRESISDFLHKLTSEIKSTPLDFVLHYLKIAEQQRTEELDEDFRSNESAPKIILRSSAMEKQAAKVYTSTMFRLFQEELLGCLSLVMEQISSDGVNSTFKLTEECGTKVKIVEFNSLESCVTCSCKKYESVGILCVHALKVLNTKNIFRIPPQYILKRWTKSAKDGVVVVDGGHESEGGEVADESMRHMHMYKSKLMRKALDVIDKSLLSVDHQQQTWMIVEDYLNMALKSVEELSKTKNSNSTRHHPHHHSTRDAAADNAMKSQLKRKRENEAVPVTVRQIKSKSSDGAITQHHPLKEGTRGGDDPQGSRRAINHSNCMEENSQQSAFRSSRPPLPSQPTPFLQVRDHGKSSVSVQECWKERAMRGVVTDKRMIMTRIQVKMEEMEKELTRIKNEHRKFVTSLNKPQRSKTHLPGESDTTTY
ncbi:hypothetical protein ACOSP7_027638 [Xanthoceras sorbifolium]